MAADAEMDARRIQALDMRLSGRSYRQIGAELRVSRQTAYDDVQFMIKEYCSETAEEVRGQEISRLDVLLMAHWEPAKSGNLKSSEMVLKIMGQRARLLGLEQTTVTMTHRHQRAMVDAEITKLAQALGVSEDEIRAEMEALNG